MKTLAALGQGLVGTAKFVAMLIIPVLIIVLFIIGVESVSARITHLLILGTFFAIAICIFILLPLSIFRSTRKFAIIGFYISSYVFGLTTWMIGFQDTDYFWGVEGVFIGLLFVGVGIVPLGIIADALHQEWRNVLMLLIGIVFTFGIRVLAMHMAGKFDSKTLDFEPSGGNGDQFE